MATANYQAGLDFVWAPGRDSPDDGYHVTPNDPGGGTFGGVIEATWKGAVARGLVSGSLRSAPRAQLATVLREEFWGPTCDALPSGLDILLFNGRMMTGAYTHLFQSCLGLTGDDVDGAIGDGTLKLASAVEPVTFIRAMTGAHYRYLSALPTWKNFGRGWGTRLLGARDIALKAATVAA